MSGDITTLILEGQKKNWGVLADCDVAGYFDFTTFLVSLSSLVKQDFLDLYGRNFQQICNDPDLYEKWCKVKLLQIHEYTHYLDVTSSLWGLSFIKEMVESYKTNPALYDAQESVFWKAKKFSRRISSLKYNDYYTTLESDDDSRPWKCIPSVGTVFDEKGCISNRPILFFSYHNSKDDRIVRTPVSMVSLLEASAMIQEWEANLIAVSLMDDVSRNIAGSKLKEKIIDFVYDCFLAEYSICFHFIAIQQQTKDINDTFALGKKIINICLNISDSDLSKIDVHKIARSYDEKYYLESNVDGFWDKIKVGINEFFDRGMLFFLITLAVPKNSFLNESKAIEGMDSVLSSSGLDYYAVIRKARREIEDFVFDLSSDSVKAVKIITEHSLFNFDVMNQEMQTYFFILTDLEFPLRFLVMI